MILQDIFFSFMALNFLVMFMKHSKICPHSFWDLFPPLELHSFAFTVSTRINLDTFPAVFPKCRTFSPRDFRFLFQEFTRPWQWISFLDLTAGAPLVLFRNLGGKNLSQFRLLFFFFYWPMLLSNNLKIWETWVFAYFGVSHVSSCFPCFFVYKW